MKLIKLKLTHGLSHSNGYVRATRENPYVTVENEEIAKKCIESGFFVRVSDDSQKSAPAVNVPAAPTAGTNVTDAANQQPTTNAQPTKDDEDELEAMTVAELKAYAETVGIDLGRLTKKADIIDAIRKAEAE